MGRWQMFVLNGVEAALLAVFARRKSVEIAKDATEVLYGGKPRLCGDASDFHFRCL